MVAIAERTLQEIVMDRAASINLGMDLEQELKRAILMDIFVITPQYAMVDSQVTLKSSLRIGTENDVTHVANFVDSNNLTNHRELIFSDLNGARNYFLDNCTGLELALAYVSVLRGEHVTSHSYETEDSEFVLPKRRTARTQKGLLKSGIIGGGLPAAATTILGYIIRGRGANIAQQALFWTVGAIAAAYKSVRKMEETVRGKKTTTIRRKKLGIVRVSTYKIKITSNDYDILPSGVLFSGEETSNGLGPYQEKDNAKLPLRAWVLNHPDASILSQAKSSSFPPLVDHPYLALKLSVQASTPIENAGFTLINAFEYKEPSGPVSPQLEKIAERVYVR